MSTNTNLTTGQSWDAELVALRDEIFAEQRAIRGDFTIQDAAKCAIAQMAALKGFAAEWDAAADAALLAIHWPTDRDHAKVAGELARFAQSWDAYAESLAAQSAQPEPEPTPPAAAAAQSRYARALANARAKAESLLADGVTATRTRIGWMVPSASSTLVYTVQDGRCSCPAGKFEKPCWHSALVEILEARPAELVSLPTLKRAA